MSPSSHASLPSGHFTLWHLLLLAACVAGVWARFSCLGIWPLTTDEYFLGRSIGWIVEQGVPRFPCGGYYIRGLLQQYLTAPLLAWSSDPEWALRVVPVSANLLGLPAVYLIGRRLGGTALACAATILYSLSIWEIELARFARMYAPFQAIFLWQIVFLLRATDGGHSARIAGRTMLLLAAVGLIVYEGGVFLLLVAALPMLTGRQAKSFGQLFPLAALGVAAVALQVIDFRRMGTAPLPDLGLLRAESGSSASLGPLALPALELSALLQTPWLLAAFLLPALLTACVLWQMLRHGRLSLAESGIWVGVLLLTAVHLFLLAALLWLLWSLWSPVRQNNRLPRLLPLALLTNLCFWLLFVSKTGEGGWRSFLTTLFGYPEIFERVIYPWATAMPITTALLIIAIAALLLLVVRRPADYAVEKTLLGCTLVVLLFLGVLETAYIEGRYSFFIYPLLLILAVDLLWRLAGLFKSSSYRAAAMVVLLAGFMVAGEDFSYGHLRAVGTAEVNFRIGYDEGRKAFYMHRRDFASPAVYINEHRQPGERVISAVRVSDFYLAQTDLVFIDHRRRSFANYLSCGGSRELWSNAPLLYRIEELRTTIDSSLMPVWIIVYADDWGGEERLLLEEEYAQHRVYRNIDGTIDVYHIPVRTRTAESALTN